MDVETLKTLLRQFKGATFASLDATFSPNPGIRCVSRGERVILYRTNGMSGYEAMVKRKLEAAGKNPDLFTVGDLPWGQRVEDLPLIYHHGKHYLQTICLAPGLRRYFSVTGRELSEGAALAGKKRRYAPEGVYVNTYDIEHIDALRLLGEELTADANTRSVLRVKYDLNPVKERKSR